MIRAVTKFHFLATAFTTVLLLSTANSSAFMGMGGGSGGSPHGGSTSAAEPEAQVKETITRHGSQGDTVVATVNEEPITMAELMANIQTIMRQKYRGMEMTDDLARRIRYNALEELALEELAYQRAVKIGALPSQDEVEARLEKVIASGGGRESFIENLSEKGQTIEDIRKEIKRYLAVRNAIDREINSQIKIDEENIEHLYQEKKDKFATQEKVTVSDIIFFLDPADKTSREKVEDVRTTLIQELDGDPGRLEQKNFFAVQSGINVSENHRKELYELAREMKPGTISQPVTIDGTLHLVKLDYYQARKEADPERVKAYLSQKLQQSRKEGLLAQWRQDLLESADIEIKHELLKEYE